MKNNSQEMDATKMTDEQLEKTRQKLRDDLKTRFDKWMDVKDEEATAEDIAAIKAEFDNEVAKYSNQTYVVEKENAIEYAKLLKEWNSKYNHWEKGGWKGIIMFDKIINEVIEKCQADATLPLEVDYSTLMYMYQSMTNPSGNGLESAIAMGNFENFDFDTCEIKDNDYYITYTHILQNVLDIIRELSNVDKKLKLMRERINIATAGIKFDWKITELEEFIELHDAWIGTAVPDGEKLAQM